MSLFLSLFGLVCGVFISAGGDFSYLITAICFALMLLPLAIKEKKWMFLLGGVGVGALLGLLPKGPFLGSVDTPGLVISAKKNYVICLVGLRRYYVSAKANSYQVFDFIHIQGTGTEVGWTRYEGRFDFNLYLSHLGVKTAIENAKTSLQWGIPLRFNALENRFLNRLSENSQAYFGNLLFLSGDNQSEILSLGSSLGMFHLLSASGAIFTLLLRLLKRIFRPFEKGARVNFIIASICLFFIPLGMAKPGIMRIIFLAWANAIAIYKKKKMRGIELNGLVGIIMILLNPYVAMQSGFLLSFGISYFLFYCQGLTIYFKGFVKKLLILSFIFIFIFPSLVASGEVHLLSMLFSLLYLPIAFVSYLCGLIGFLSVPIPPFLNWISETCLNIMTLFSKADLSLPIPFSMPYFALVYYPVILITIYLIELGDYLHAFRISFITVSCLLISLVPFQYYLSQEVCFINVGQGDAILLRSYDKVVLLDSGGVNGFDIGEEVLLPYLRKKRIYHIDAFIASHHDFDHIGGLSTLQSAFKEMKVYDDASFFPLDIGDMHFENLNVYDYEEENDKSLVLTLDFIDRKWIFTGDAPKEVEKRIISDHPELDCDILKVGHHGSKTSSCAEFLDTITPEIAIISCGLNNRYGHPDDEVIQRLEERNITIRRTDIEGSISYTKWG